MLVPPADWATRTSEPPSGADPDRPPYESGAATVRGGIASGAGLEPAKAGVRALLGTPTPHPEPVRAERFELSSSRVWADQVFPGSRHARVPPRGLEPLHARLRVWCPASRAQTAYFTSIDVLDSHR
jgi:hypothetical protein